RGIKGFFNNWPAFGFARAQGPEGPEGPDQAFRRQLSRGAGRLEVLLVADVGDRALVQAFVAGRERVAATGHDVLRADRDLAAPRGAPGQAEAQALEPRLAGGVDDPADDVGAERAIAATDLEAAGVPAVGQALGGAGEGDQPGP